MDVTVLCSVTDSLSHLGQMTYSTKFITSISIHPS